MASGAVKVHKEDTPSSVQLAKDQTQSLVSVQGTGNFVVATGANSNVTFHGLAKPLSNPGEDSADCSKSQKSYREVFLYVQKHCAKEWKRILRHLRWPISDMELENEIDAISNRDPGDLKEQCYQGLRLWAGKCSDTSIGNLVAALKDCDLTAVAEGVAKMDM